MPSGMPVMAPGRAGSRAVIDRPAVTWPVVAPSARSQGGGEPAAGGGGPGDEGGVDGRQDDQHDGDDGGQLVEAIKFQVVDGEVRDWRTGMAGEDASNAAGR